MNTATFLNSGIAKTVLLTLATGILISSCKRDKPAAEKHCWQVIDVVGNNLNYICDKTEAELLACAKAGTCGILNGGPGFSNCNYYMADGPKECYNINGSVYPEKITESHAALLAKCFGNRSGVYFKTTCVICAFWYHREKRTYKPTNTFVYSQITRQQFCSDTLATLYQGRQVTRKNDEDSLIVIQFSNDGTTW